MNKRRGRKKKGLCPVCGSNLQVTKQELFETLNIDEEKVKETGLTEKEVKEAYREAAKKNHPDKGGDPLLFKELTDAKEELMEMVKEELDPLNINPIGDALTRQAMEDFEEPLEKPKRISHDQLKEVLRSIKNLKQAKAMNPNMACPLCKKRPRRQ